MDGAFILMRLRRIVWDWYSGGESSPASTAHQRYLRARRSQDCMTARGHVLTGVIAFFVSFVVTLFIVGK